MIVANLVTTNPDSKFYSKVSIQEQKRIKRIKSKIWMHHRYDDSVSLKFQLSEHSIVESIDSDERPYEDFY